MASMTIQNPGLGELFSGLAGLMAGPSPEALINADLRRVQRDDTLALTDLRRQELATKQRGEQALRDAAVMLGDPSLATTPEGRAKLISVLSQTPEGMKLGPGFATGAASFVDPNFVESDADYSRVLAGTGVQPNWSQTPTGYAQGLQNNIDQQGLINQGNLAKEALSIKLGGGGGTGSRTPLDLGPNDAQGLAELLSGMLASQYGDATVDPEAMRQLQTDAASLYQQTRNAQVAADRAMELADLAVTGQSGGFFGIGANPGTVTAGAPGLGDVLAPPAPAPLAPPATMSTPGPSLPAPGGDPAASQSGAAAGMSVPTTHYDQDGTPFMTVAGQRKNLSPGAIARNKATGQVMVWDGTKFVARQGAR